MLGGLAVLVMLAGVLIAAGALFDWEFLFSDGRSPHAWTASMGRLAARTMLGLAGCGLMAGGFVARAIAVANMPQAAAAPTDDSIGSLLKPNRDTPGPSAETPNANPTQSVEREPLRGSQAARVGQRPAVSETKPPVEAPPPAVSPRQVITLWNPTATVEPGGTMLFTVNYRFEAGRRAHADEQYLWVLDLTDKTRAVQYDGSVLQQQGQLQHVVQTPDALAPGLGTWRTNIRLGSDETSPQVSNLLTVTGEEVQSTAPQ